MIVVRKGSWIGTFSYNGTMMPYQTLLNALSNFTQWFEEFLCG